MVICAREGGLIQIFIRFAPYIQQLALFRVDHTPRQETRVDIEVACVCLCYLVFL